MPPARSYWFALAAVCLSVATAWAVWSGGRATPQAPPAPNAVTAPTYHLSTSPRASWRLLEETSVVRIELLNGRFDCQVDKLESGQRFVLQLPDGELEVKGTRFITDVANGRTRSVSVQEGRVALRMQGQPEVFLVGGDVWPPIDAESDDRETQPPSTPTAPPKSVGAQRIASAPSAPRASTSSSAPGASPSASEPVAPSTASEFARAMSAYSAGDFARAEVLFLQFEQHHPRDGRVEDSAFLRAVARSRRGDPDGAAALAREYLRRFPRGLRRLEAERLAGTQ